MSRSGPLSSEQAAALRWLCEECPSEAMQMLLRLPLQFLPELELEKSYLALRGPEGGGNSLSVRFARDGGAHIDVLSVSDAGIPGMEARHFRIGFHEARANRIRTALLMLALAAHLEG